MTKEEILQDVGKTAAALILNDGKNTELTFADLKFDGTYPWNAEQFYAALSKTIRDYEHGYDYYVDNFFAVIEEDKDTEHLVYIIRAVAFWLADTNWPYRGSRFIEDLCEERPKYKGLVISQLLESPYSLMGSILARDLYLKTDCYYPEITEALSKTDINRRMKFISFMRQDYPEQNFRVLLLLYKSELEEEKITYAPHPYGLRSIWINTPFACHNSSEIIEFNHYLFAKYRQNEISAEMCRKLLEKEFKMIKADVSLIIDSLPDYHLLCKEVLFEADFKKVMEREFSLLKEEDVPAVESFTKDIFCLLRNDMLDSAFCRKMILKIFDLIKTADNAFFEKLNAKLQHLLLEKKLPAEFYLEVILTEFEYQTVSDISFFEKLNQQLYGLVVEHEKISEDKLVEIILREYVILKDSASPFLLNLYQDLILMYCRCHNFEALYKQTEELTAVPFVSENKDKLIILIVRLVMTLKELKHPDGSKEAQRYYKFSPLIEIYQNFNYKPFRLCL